MESLGDRQQFVEDILASIEEERQRKEKEEEQEENGETETAENQEQESPNMPSDLSTPVSLMQSAAENAKKKKKKKKRSKTAGLPEAGSALDDSYKEKFDEDIIENPYDPSRPLSERVEYAIWKYRKNHKFSEMKRAIFDNYLKFGGITVGPNAFLGRTTGADAPEDPDAEADWEAAKTATDVVPDQLDDDEELVVSFSEVAQVYLGNTFVRESRFIGLQDFIDAPMLVDAFLRYLEIRNVCPEYADDIRKAREITAKAKKELPMCKRAANLMPGHFNKACSALFDGGLKPAWALDSASWAGATLKTQNLVDDFLADTLGMDMGEVRKTVEHIIKNPSQRTVVDQREGLFVKVIKIAETQDDDPPEKLIPTTLASYDDEKDQFPIYLEKKIVNELLEGMVMTATLYKLDCGQWYLDRASLIMPTFYMYDDCMDEEVFFYD